MTFLLFIQITFVCLLGAMSPGPSMMVVINNSIFKNRFNGILTALGHGFGIGIYALFAVIGIGLIIKANFYLFTGLKTLSIIFLLYLGIQALVKTNHVEFNEGRVKDGIQSFFQGLSISILNPKILIWFLAIYSQFMSLNNDIFFKPIDIGDNTIPNGNSIMLINLVRLGMMEQAKKLAKSLNGYLNVYKSHMMTATRALDFFNNINSGKNCNEQGCKIDV